VIVLPGWLGWVAIAAIAIVFGWLFYRQRRAKATDTRSHHICQRDGYPDVHVPQPIDRDGAEKIAHLLRNVIDNAWKEFTSIYYYAPLLPLVTIGMSRSEVHPDHPHVLWIMPRDKLFLRLQVGMAYYLAGELHNVFRYLLHGPNGIYSPRSDQDEVRMMRVQDWIEATYNA
jgi:hypothetical protein